jgi:hypothetical protein
LFALAPHRTEETEAAFARAELPLWRIGEVIEGTGVEVAL